MNKQEKQYIKRYLETYDEYELRTHVKRYPNRSQTQTYFEQHALPIIVMSKLRINLLEDANIVQEIARQIKAERLSNEQKNSKLDQKKQLEANLVLLRKLKPNISVTSRRKCQVEIGEKEGTLVWHCNGIDTLEGGGVRRCQHIQKHSLVEDEAARQPNFVMDFSEKYKQPIEVGKGRVLPPMVKTIAGRQEISGGNIERGPSPLIGSLAKGSEILLVMRCPECMRSDELTLKLAVKV